MDAGLPHKRPRRSPSYSSLFGDSSSSDEDEVILTHNRKPIPIQKRESKPIASRPGPKITKPKTHHTTVANAPPVRQRKINLILPTKAKQPTSRKSRPVEIHARDKQKESQQTSQRVSVPNTTHTNVVPVNPAGSEKPAEAELRNGIINIVPVKNDGEPKSWVILTGLKALFRKQLPQMPHEYITRLMYDSNSTCLAIVKHGFQVVGGICHRPFPHRGFTEIAFFAVASVDQVKGYGGMLMNHFKAHIRQTYPTINHFLTYADNYAVGYFKKQGFTKEVTLDPSLWIGYIKDYDGGTIMECTMLPKVDYLRIKDIIHAQREAVIEKITEKSTSHVVYPGLRWWKKGRTGPIDPEHVPGLRELGWSPAVAALTKRLDPHDGERLTMKRLLAELERHPKSWPFMQPVSSDDVPDYYNHIQKPMDFSTMEHKIETNQYTTLDGFISDAKLVFSNCKWYNGPDTVYHKAAITMEKFFKEQLSLLKGTGKRKREN